MKLDASQLKKFRVRRIFKEAIEPEEILMDASKKPELHDRKLEVPIRPNVFRGFLILVGLVFLILLGQAGYLQLAKGESYSILAENNRIRILPVLAPRGIIFDTTYEQLVFNAPSFDLVLVPRDLSENKEEKARVISETAKILGMGTEKIYADLKQFGVQSVQSVTLASGLSHEQVLAFESAISRLAGLRLEKNATRQYVDPLYFSHVLGYLGRLTEADTQKNSGYYLTEKIGRQGLESAYEKILRGVPGEKLVEVDSMGQEKGVYSENQFEAGQNLVLALDARLQRLLYDRLAATLSELKLKKAAAVAVNPQTGGVLALVSFPSFDNNLFSQNLTRDIYDALTSDPSQPLFNRAVSGQYASGSVVKPMIGAAALQEKVVSLGTKIDDSAGAISIGDYKFADWKAHGVVDIYDAIAQSCDVYFYTAGGGYGNISGLGIERLNLYLKMFGFGKALGVDLTGERPGLVPDNEWKLSVKNERWYVGDTYHLSIGQGDFLVTPLQMAVATAAVANGGKVIRPHLVDKIVDSDKNIIKSVKPEILNENFVDAKNFEAIRKGMRLAVTEGSARRLGDLSVATGAKTGTAQVAGQKNTNAWATLFAPFDKPTLALAILVEDAGEGSQVAIPIARDVLEKYYK